MHPQRSVITRALGTDPDVDVDAFSVGDEARRPVHALLGRAVVDGRRRRDPRACRGAPRRPRRDAARRSSTRRTRSGGEDNITVVLFEIAALDDTIELPGTIAAGEPSPSPRTRTRSAASTRCRRAARGDRRPRSPRRRRRSAGASRGGSESPLTIVLVALRRGRRGVRPLARELRGRGRQRLRGRLPGRAVEPPLRRPPLPRGLHEPPARGRALAAERKKLFDHTLRGRNDAEQLVRRTATTWSERSELPNRELISLVVVALMTGFGFASVYIARQDVISTTSLSLRHLLPRALPRRPRRHALHRAGRRPLPAAARRPALRRSASSRSTA